MSIRRLSRWFLVVLVLLIAAGVFLIDQSPSDKERNSIEAEAQDDLESDNQHDPIGEEVASWLSENSGKYQALGRVKTGDVIGKTGSTGNSTGAHLHLGVWSPSGNDYINPVHNRRTQKLKYGFEWPYKNEEWQISRWFDCTGFWTSAQKSNCPYMESSWGNGRFFHNGVDVAAPTGSLVRAIGDGEIIYKGVWGGAGYTIMIEHDNGLISRYFHLLPF